MGCFWGWRDNNSYVSIHQTDQVCAEDNSKCFNQSEVFVDRTVPGVSDTCGQICYAACECNTSNGWYPTCQGTDCYKVVDTRYAGKPNAASASRSLSDIGSISASGANSGISASAAATAGATSGISTLASGATTCYKTKTCSEGGYYDSVPADQKCSSKSYNGYSCYTGCSYKTCSDYGYNSSIPSGKTCTPVYPRSGLTCYKDCKDEIKYYSVTASFSYDSSCPESYVSAYNGISGFKVGTQYYSYHENSYTVSNVAKGTAYSWTPGAYSSASPAAYPSPSSFSGTVNSDVTLHATYSCSGGNERQCPPSMPYPYNPNGEDCCCVDLNWTGGCSGSWCIPTSCVCYGTTRPQPFDARAQGRQGCQGYEVLVAKSKPLPGEELEGSGLFFIIINL